MPKGHDVAPKIRFMSTQRSEYTDKNHRRIFNNPDFRPLPDYIDYTKFVNNEYTKQKEEILSKTILSEDLEATTIVSCVPAKKNTLSEALEKIRN